MVLRMQGFSVKEIFVPIYELPFQYDTTPVYHFKLDSSLVPKNPNFGQKLQKLNFYSDSDGKKNSLLQIRE